MKRTSITALLFTIIMSLVSCSETENEYDNYLCYFSFDTNIHNTSIIRNALNPLASGTFVKVETTVEGGIRYVKSELNDGKTREKEKITTEREIRQTYALGIYNKLIIGYGSLGDGKLYAYDGMCPYCFKENGIYKELSWTNNGHWVHCNTCGNSYDLNNGGVVVKGEGTKKLIRYRTSNTDYMLIVHN